MFRIGILGAADIAYNKFLPALKEVEGAECVGVASLNSPDKLSRFARDYDVPCYDSYEKIIDGCEADCIYIPLPPAFHYEWAKKSLLAGKHVFLEKPSTVCQTQAEELVSLAEERGLVIQENYMFQYHSQIKAIKDIIDSGELGTIRQYNTQFGFPRRAGNDFRYMKELGGGTMLDNGGYTIKLMSMLLGDSARLVGAYLDYEKDTGIDIFGSAQFVNDEGIIGIASFGMDCAYRCSLEVWGSKGRLATGRIYTAPAGLCPEAVIETASESRQIKLPACNHFVKSIEMFISATKDEKIRKSMAKGLMRQAELSEAVRVGGAN